MKIILTSIIILFLAGWAFLAGAAKLNDDHCDPMSHDQSEMEDQV